jgi:UTP--glucose-1-phosphate uridylyltransferase
MAELYTERGGNIIAVEEVPPAEVHRYGVVGEAEREGNAFRIDRMVEKPRRGEAPSNLIISGRYILQPEIFEEIAHQEPGAGGEIQITDAMVRLMARQAFHGLQYHGTTYDCGDKVGFLAANVAYGLAREDLGPAFRQALRAIIAKEGGYLSWQRVPSLEEILQKIRAGDSVSV